MRLVLIESPFTAPTREQIEFHQNYARTAMQECLVMYKEAPFTSHLLYTQPGVLNDEIAEERALGMDAGLLWGAKADATIIYIDCGLSNGMRKGIGAALALHRPIEIRRLRSDWCRQWCVKDKNCTFFADHVGPCGPEVTAELERLLGD